MGMMMGNKSKGKVGLGGAKKPAAPKPMAFVADDSD